MPEEGLETLELKEKLDEAAEHAHGGHGHGDHDGHKAVPGWITPLSLSTALIAVLAAISSLQSGTLANESLIAKGEASLAQDKEDDLWAWYQAKSSRAALYNSQAKLARALEKEDLAKSFEADGKRETDEKMARDHEAREMEKEVAAREDEATELFEKHHQFARSVTIFQVAIALAAIAALTRKKMVWIASLVVGAFGLFFMILGYKPDMLGGEHKSEPKTEAPAASSAGPPTEKKKE